MSETKPQSGDALDTPPPKKGRGKLLILIALVLLLGGGGAAAWFFVPAIGDMARGVLGPKEPAAPVVAANQPFFLELPEMALTLPNGGHPRQMRIKLTIEVAQGIPQKGAADALSPRVYDALLTYLRTLHEGEIDGGLGLDRLRADLYRRMELIMGPGIMRDVLITSLILA